MLSLIERVPPPIIRGSPKLSVDRIKSLDTLSSICRAKRASSEVLKGRKIAARGTATNGSGTPGTKPQNLLCLPHVLAREAEFSFPTNPSEHQTRSNPLKRSKNPFFHPGEARQSGAGGRPLCTVFILKDSVLQPMVASVRASLGNAINPA